MKIIGDIIPDVMEPLKALDKPLTKKELEDMELLAEIKGMHPRASS